MSRLVRTRKWILSRVCTHFVGLAMLACELELLFIFTFVILPWEIRPFTIQMVTSLLVSEKPPFYACVKVMVYINATQLFTERCVVVIDEALFSRAHTNRHKSLYSLQNELREWNEKHWNLKGKWKQAALYMYLYLQSTSISISISLFIISLIFCNVFILFRKCI